MQIDILFARHEKHRLEIRIELPVDEGDHELVLEVRNRPEPPNHDVDLALAKLLNEETVEGNDLDPRNPLKGFLDEREPLIVKLREGLALAETLIAERDAEIARLRAGLSHAETLAFERARELAELQKSWLWKCRIYLMRRKARRATPPPA